MKRSWVVDTNLIVDWCLWELADSTQEGLSQRATTQFSVLRIADHRRSFERSLEVAASVRVAQPTLIEVGLTLQRLLSSRHRGSVDRLGPQVVLAGLRFLERFRVEAVHIAEELLRGELRHEHGPGDAVLVAALEKDASLLTSDKNLWRWCRNKDIAATHFLDGDLRAD